MHHRLTPPGRRPGARRPMPVATLAIAAVIWAPELLQGQNFLLFSFCTGAGQLGAYAMGVWPVKQGAGASVLCAFCAFMAVALWMTSAMSADSNAE